MSRSAENQNWAILAHHHYAAELQNLIHSIILLNGLALPTEDFEKFLMESGAGL